MTDRISERRLSSGGTKRMKQTTRHAWLLATLLLAACGAGSTPASTATPPDQASQPTDPPVEAPAPGNAGGIAAPAIDDAMYTGGTVHVEVTGGKTLTADAVLVQGVSMTTEGTTLLMYLAGEGQDAVTVSISNGADTGLAMTISAAEVITGGDASTGCAFDLTRNDSSGLGGTFRCDRITALGLDTATIDASVTFSADR